MKKEIKLSKPILIDNAEVSTLTYDMEEITPMLFSQADTKKRQASGMKNFSISLAAEFDFALHLYMGFAAIIAVNPAYTFEDLERVKGRDINDIRVIGRDFLLSSAEDSPQNVSEKQSEPTPKPTEPISTK